MPFKDIAVRRAYGREWMRKRRRAFFADKHCARCGAIDDLQLDHIKRQGKVDHRIFSWSSKRRRIELEKCQILCEECHKEKTREENRLLRGEKSSNAKFTNKQAKAIRRMSEKDGLKARHIAEVYEVHPTTIRRLLKYLTY